MKQVFVNPNVFAQSQGFENMRELSSMVARVNLSQPSVAEQFKCWQCNDGSKAGLEALLKQQGVCHEQQR